MASSKRHELLTGAVVPLASGSTRRTSANALYGGEDEEYVDPALLPPRSMGIGIPMLSAGSMADLGDQTIRWLPGSVIVLECCRHFLSNTRNK